MIKIKSAAEQKFLTQLVLNSSYSNNVWIGAERRPDSETEFNWSDGSDFDLYSNWAIGRPSAEVRRTCVIMQSELSRQLSDLEWADHRNGNGLHHRRLVYLPETAKLAI